jgi:hypothetical protein
MHFGAVRTVDDRERFYHDDPLRDLEPGQSLEATRPRALALTNHPGRPGTVVLSSMGSAVSWPPYLSFLLGLLAGFAADCFRGHRRS